MAEDAPQKPGNMTASDALARLERAEDELARLERYIEELESLLRHQEPSPAEPGPDWDSEHVPLLEDAVVPDELTRPAGFHTLSDAIDATLADYGVGEMGQMDLYRELADELEEIVRTGLDRIGREVGDAMHARLKAHVQSTLQRIAAASASGSPSTNGDLLRERGDTDPPEVRPWLFHPIDDPDEEGGSSTG